MPYQNSLTQKERNYLEDALQMENLCMTKCSVYSDQCQNQQLKSLFFEHAKARRQHANQIKQMLGQPGNMQYQQNRQYQ